MPQRKLSESVLPEVYYGPTHTAAGVKQAHLSGQAEKEVHYYGQDEKQCCTSTVTDVQPTSKADMHELLPRPPRRILGLRRWLFFVILTLSVLTVVGGVVGGFTIKKVSTKTAVSPASSTVTSPASATSAAQKASTASAVPPATSLSTSSTGPAATSTSNPAIINRYDFTYPNIAASISGLNEHIQVVWVAMPSTQIFLATYDGDGWAFVGSLDTVIAPLEATPITIISWEADGSDQIRIYFFDTASLVVELSGSCSFSGNCTLVHATWITNVAASPYSSLSAVYWNNTGSPAIRIYLTNPQNYLCELAYWGQWGTPKVLTPANEPVSTFNGSSIAATVDSINAPIVLRVYYTAPNGSISEVTWNNEWIDSGTPLAATNTSGQASICATNGLTTPGDLDTSIFQIRPNLATLEMTSSSGDGSWNVNQLQNLAAADNAGGAVACIEWLSAGQQQVRLYYASEGIVQEVQNIGGIWSNGTEIGNLGGG